MRIGIGLSMAANAPRYDADDLAKGTLSLDFTATNEPTLLLDFSANDYRTWVDDPTWPYGVAGVFKRKA